MVKLGKPTGSNQYKITIPSDIIDATGWNKNTELLFVPFIQDPKETISKNTPILLKEFKPEYRPSKTDSKAEKKKVIE